MTTPKTEQELAAEEWIFEKSISEVRSAPIFLRLDEKVRF